MAIDARPLTAEQMADYLDDFIWRVENDELTLPRPEFEAQATEAARNREDPAAFDRFWQAMGSQSFALLEAMDYLREYQALLRGQASSPRLSNQYPKAYQGVPEGDHD